MWIPTKHAPLRSGQPATRRVLAFTPNSHHSPSLLSNPDYRASECVFWICLQGASRVDICMTIRPGGWLALNPSSRTLLFLLFFLFLLVLCPLLSLLLLFHPSPAAGGSARMRWRRANQAPKAAGPCVGNLWRIRGQHTTQPCRTAPRWEARADWSGAVPYRRWRLLGAGCLASAGLRHRGFVRVQEVGYEISAGWTQAERSAHVALLYDPSRPPPLHLAGGWEAGSETRCLLGCNLDLAYMHRPGISSVRWWARHMARPWGLISSLSLSSVYA